MDYVGVDGCRAGWVWIGFDAAGRREAGIARTTDALAAVVQAARLALIDIPIGLRDEGARERLCDLEARRVLGAPRGSSVFPAPARTAAYEAGYDAACETNARLCGRRLSRQSWGIARKIRSIDELLNARPELRPILRECHPEVCFWSLNGKRAMRENKKRRAGHAERIEVLEKFFPEAGSVIAAAAGSYPRKDVARDDVIDALVLAVTARRGYGRLQTLPAAPERDAEGLPMEIVFTA